MLELIWLKSEVVTVPAIFHWPSLDLHRRMNHKQSRVVKMIGLLLQNVILCYSDCLCLLACTHWQNMWLSKIHIGLLTYNSVKEKVNMNALPRMVTILEIRFIAYEIYLFCCGTPWLTVFLIFIYSGKVGWRGTLIFIQLQYTALTPRSCTLQPLFSVAGQWAAPLEQWEVKCLAQGHLYLSCHRSADSYLCLI